LLDHGDFVPFFGEHLCCVEADFSGSYYKNPHARLSNLPSGARAKTVADVVAQVFLRTSIFYAHLGETENRLASYSLVASQRAVKYEATAKDKTDERRRTKGREGGRHHHEPE
jgi:hypothetical protein